MFSRKSISKSKQRKMEGGILLEFTLVVPVFIMFFAVILNVTFYLINLWIIHAVVLPQGLAMAAKGDSLYDVEVFTEELLVETLTASVRDIDVIPTLDAATNTVTLEASAVYDLVFKFKPIVSSIEINAVTVGLTP